MRWESLQLDPDGPLPADAPGRAVPLLERGAVARTFDTPRYRGMTFYEVQARSVLNRVPEPSRVPFRWTVNPYRGCSHACVYCFARGTHAYLDLGTGADFDTQVVVKVNAAEVLRRELAAPRWQGETVAMGTNVDCYQRVEGRYRLMPGILAALRDAANPFSLLTKGTLVLRDLPVLRQAATVTDVSTAVSVGFLDRPLWRLLEPGTPAPQARLDVCRQLTAAGVRCSVLMAPVVPYLTDTEESLEATVAAIAASGAGHVTPIVLHLRPGAREWFLAWLARHHPHLVPRYEQLYGSRTYAPTAYQRQVTERMHELARRYGVGAATPGTSPHRRPRPAAPPVPAPAPAVYEQPSLL